jgi:hypothetical protein
MMRPYPRGEHGHGISRRGVLLHQGPQRLGPEQRHVAVGDDDRAGHDAEVLDHHAHRVAGTEQLLLHHQADLRGQPRGLRADLLPAVPGHHDQPVRLKFAGRRERVPEHAAPAQAVQHLGNPGFHPGALACGQDNHSDGARFAHAAGLLG